MLNNAVMFSFLQAIMQKQQENESLNKVIYHGAIFFNFEYFFNL